MFSFGRMKLHSHTIKVSSRRPLEEYHSRRVNKPMHTRSGFICISSKYSTLLLAENVSGRYLYRRIFACLRPFVPLALYRL